MASATRFHRGLCVTAVLATLGVVQAGADSSRDLSGRWVFTLTPPNRGQVAIRMTVGMRGSTWSASSRHGAARAFAPWWKYRFGRLTGKVPARGALAWVEAGRIAEPGNAPGLRAEFRSPILGNFHLSGASDGSTISGELRRDSAGPAVGTFTAVRDTAPGPLRDYEALARAIRQTALDFVFDPRLPRSALWQEFFAGVDKGMRDAVDDLDALAAFYAGLPRLRLSHLNLVRDPELARMPLDSIITRVAGPPDSLVSLQIFSPDVAYLWVRKWDQVTAEIDRAFRRVDSLHVGTLIIDIRGNPGGDNSAGAPLAHLYRDTSHAGVFLTNKWFSFNPAPPTGRALDELPLVTRDDGLEIIHALREHGAVRVASAPREPYFAGRVYVLINGGSGSASEPLAHHLKSTGRATLIGEPTAGRMLTALPHDLGQGWVLVLPEADYYASDGVRLEGRGVTPHISVPWREAIAAAGTEIGKSDARSGAVVRAVAFMWLARWMDAVTAYREAASIGPEPTNLRTTLERTIRRRLDAAPGDRDAEAALRRLTGR
jgi:hypothetical protein